MISFKDLSSSLEYRYPVGFPGLHIRIPLVLGVISFSNSSIGGSANPLSILAVTGITFNPPDTANPL